MWLLILAYAAVLATIAWYSRAGNDSYMLKYLALILWGATIMVFIDHLITYLEGGSFLNISTDSLLLGFTMLLVALIIWEAILVIKDPKSVWRRVKTNQ